MAENELLNRKLALEITELQKPWYKKANYLSIAPALVIAVFTIFLSIRTGLFDLRNENLKLERNILSLQIVEFTQKRDSIKNSYESMVDSIIWLKNAVVTKEIELTRNYEEKNKLFIDKLRSENKLEGIIDYYKGQLDSLTKLTIKKEALGHALTDEDGNYILTEDGKYLMFDGKPLTFGDKPITADRTDIAVDNTNLK